jgi:hypothetical protein
VRLTRADFSFSCKSFLKIEFAQQDITAFGGLELLRRYLALIELGCKYVVYLLSTRWVGTTGRSTWSW